MYFFYHERYAGFYKGNFSLSNSMRTFRDELSDATRVITKQRFLKTKGVSLFVFHLLIIITFQHFVINQLMFLSISQLRYRKGG